MSLTVKKAKTTANYDWQVEEDLRTIQRANEIKADPKRMALVKAMAKTKLEEIAAIAGAVA
jgi:hypothetical protein